MTGRRTIRVGQPTARVAKAVPGKPPPPSPTRPGKPMDALDDETRQRLADAGPEICAAVVADVWPEVEAMRERLRQLIAESLSRHVGAHIPHDGEA